jgi:uncharacterized membrane protein YdbT with pleckstrin-like domain
VGFAFLEESRMSYIEENLLSDENIRYKAKISFLSFVPHILLMAIGIGFITIIKPLIAYFTTEMGVTNKRFIFKTGLISRDSLELNLSKVENVRINQSLIGRILGYGDVTVVGTGGTRAVVNFIDNPQNLKREISSASDDGAK